MPPHSGVLSPRLGTKPRFPKPFNPAATNFGGVMAYETILVETRGGVGLITLNRPQALNALNSILVNEVDAALDGFEADPNVSCVVITGSEKAFAAGPTSRRWRVSAIRK